MDTSKSPDAETPSEASALIFSGRPDPIWTLPAALTRQLLDLWNQAKPVQQMPSLRTGLGYRGCTWRMADDEWIACDGTITRYRKGNAVESRADVGRKFERLLIGSCPGDAVPAQFLDPELR